jgi:hypothetical protein
MLMDRLQARLMVFARSPRLLLFFIILLALIPRLLLLPVSGHYSDLSRFFVGSQYIIENGLFKMYDSPIGINHPPVGVGLQAGSTWVWHTLTGNDIDDAFDPDNGGQVAALKYASLLFELALIALIFEIMLREANVKWAAAIALLFAFSPGHLLAVDGMGQTDSIYTFFLVATLFLLKRRHPRWAWAAYAIAWLSKFQSIMILPIMIVWTLRRYGPRTLILNLLLFVTIIGAGMLPFVANSGVKALVPYRQGAVNLQPHITNGSYNLWYWVSNATTSIREPDAIELVSGISYFQAGLLLFSLVTGLICLRAWLLPEQNDEYLVAAAAGVAFFMLPTQIHSRYLYAGLVFLTLALRQAPGLFPIQIGFMLNFGQNIWDTMGRDSNQVRLPTEVIFWDDTLNAIANTIFFVVLLACVLWPLWAIRGEVVRRMRDSLHAKELAGLGALVTLALLIFISDSVIPSPRTDTLASLRQWVANSVPYDGRILVPESSLLATKDWGDIDRWQAADVTAWSPDQWATNGVSYLALTDDDLNTTAGLRAYVDNLLLLKRIAPGNPIGPDAISIYRMLFPRTATDLEFDHLIRMVGYDLTIDSGESIGFRPYWRAISRPYKDYWLFVHLLPPERDTIIAQADWMPAYNSRSTLSWVDPAETLIGTDMLLTLPDDLPPGTYRLAVGLYNWRTGERLLLAGGDHYVSIAVVFE